MRKTFKIQVYAVNHKIPKWIKNKNPNIDWSPRIKDELSATMKLTPSEFQYLKNRKYVLGFTYI